MWEINKNGTKVYLLGSIHFTKESMYPINEKIENAFIHSDYAYFEIDFFNTMSPSEIDEITKSIMMEPNIFIDSLISDDEYNLLSEKLNEVELNISTLRNYKPMYIYLLYTSKILQENFSSDLPIDVYFYNKAKEENKLIGELEGIKLQYNIMYNLSLDLQLALLLESMETENFIEHANKLLDAWTVGDFAQMENYFEGFELSDIKLVEEYRNELIYKRNKEMVEKIAKIIDSKDGKTHFIIAGIGHMIGPENLIELLIQLGYDVKKY